MLSGWCEVLRIVTEETDGSSIIIRNFQLVSLAVLGDINGLKL